MNDLLRLILDSITYLWPVKIVMEYERGVYYVCGRYWKEMGPGPKLVPPFFAELRIESVVPDVYVTRLQSIETKDGKTLTYSATMEIEIVDLNAAYNRVHNYGESALETASAVLSEKLAEVGAEMLTPEKRGYLIAGCLGRLRTELSPLGLKVNTLRFNNFVRQMRIVRLFNDQSYASS